MNSKEIRQTFLDFFSKKQHQIVPSAPMVMKNDPTLLFTNAGMNQFKEYFLGNSKAEVKRVADTQKCLRVSGKHNDLEEVGKDTYHHTMFEMLGNWSFGDYFKKEAIEWAWELLTEVYQIPQENLYVTVFEGSADEDGLSLDQEAFDLWKAIVPESQILLGNKKDNFWEMGEQGPCGPCSEIHIDLRSPEEKKQIPGADLVNKDHPQVVEIWNLVFMQYNRKADRSLEPLPEKHVDTGMGFERLCMVLQSKTSNYDTDVFTPLISELERISSKKYGTEETTDIAIRVIVDHLRAVSFAIADGQLPSNNGAGYVIRRILRRAIRYGFTFLNLTEAFVFKLVDVLIKELGGFYTELQKQEQLIVQVIKEEEQSFLRTLEQGLKLLDKITKNSTTEVISGATVFELYDTYGFPVDLTALILEEKGLKYDHAAFQEELKKQKERSRSAAATSTTDWVSVHQGQFESFLGYDALQLKSKLIKYRAITSNKNEMTYQLVFNSTPFYPEGGGQIGDRGFIENDKGEQIQVIATKKENNEILHFVKKLPTHLDVDFTLKVDAVKRRNTCSNHTATHLLHHALRNVLGSHVEQRGSSVNENGLRFDFSHFSKVQTEELVEIEKSVNTMISEAIELVEEREINMQEALDKGAMALFGEKYGDKVRTIQFGPSVELCGGTHVQTTSDIWHFKIKAESAVASGIRRIEAITSKEVKGYFQQLEEDLKAIDDLFPKAQNTYTAIEQLQNENADLKNQLQHLLNEKAALLKQQMLQDAESINGMNIYTSVNQLDPAALKNICTEIGSNDANAVVVMGSNNGAKALLSCYISKELVESKGLNAGQMVKTLGRYIQGGGGGQAFFATAGGKNPDGLNTAIEEAKKLIASL
ncbi:MAG: alanine--tRNA ligase [Flavobacteriaceae bacterium]